MSLMEGLHTELGTQDTGFVDSDRSRDLWWTVYSLDRQLSSSLGVPMAVQDHDITTPLLKFEEVASDHRILVLRVRLLRVLSMILHGMFSMRVQIYDC